MFINLFQSGNQYGNGGKDCNRGEMLPVDVRVGSETLGGVRVNRGARESSVWFGTRRQHLAVLITN